MSDEVITEIKCYWSLQKKANETATEEKSWVCPDAAQWSIRGSLAIESSQEFIMPGRYVAPENNFFR